MERLTERLGNGLVCLVDWTHPGDIATKALQRLAAYEDTGLEPERVAELAQAERDGRLVVLPEVPEADRQAFVDGLHDYFQEAANHDPSVGIFGMRDGEAELAKALMDALDAVEAALENGKDGSEC